MEPYKYPYNKELFNRALRVIPSGIYGHLGPVESCFIPVEAYPLFSAKAKGAYFWDADGNRFIDYMCAYGPNVLGYNDEEVDEAVRKQMTLGNCVTSPSAIMIDMAELLVDTVAMADWAFFAKNGGDTTSFALMIARAATGRKKVVLVNGGYHGVAPWTQKLGYPGVTAADIENNLYVDWNDYKGLKKIVEENKGEIACFMSTPYHHPVFEDSQLPQPDYWNKVRELCTKEGIVLAVDDVRCGFRLDAKGSDHYFGFKADLMCFCKALGNGYNFSAICGNDSLKDAAASVMYTGSYWLSAIPFAAGIACINKLKRIQATDKMYEGGKRLTEGLKQIGKDFGFNLKISGHPSMWYMRIADDDSLMLHQEWVAECAKRGIFFTSHHNLFMNTAISKEDIDYTFEIAHQAFSILRDNHPQ